MENLFIWATRHNVTFAYKGTLTIQDVWSLPLKDLDAIYKQLNGQLKLAKEESLLDTKSAADKKLEAQIEIIKFIVKTKQEEQQKAVDAKERSEKRQELLGILANKKAEELQGKTAAEIEKMIAELE